LKERKMTRTSSTLILVLATLGAAIAAVPAMASDDYRSMNSITGGSSGDRGKAQPSDFTSVNAAVGPDSSGRSPVSSADSDPSSLNAVLATAPGRPVQSSGSGSDYRSLTSIVGADGLPQQSPPPVVDDRKGDGFDWFDALIGALIVSGLTLTTLAAARTVERHRRATAESRA
jgi:hypothetical protein